MEEINATLVKIRWDRKSRDWLSDPDTEEEDKQTQDKLQERDKLQEAETRLIYKSDSDNIDLRSCCATDMAHNKRVHLPQPRPAGEEAVLGTRLGIWKKTVDQFVARDCNPGGQLKTHNLSNSERTGLIKLKKRIKSGEIVVLRSDKGNRFTVSSVSSYEKQGDCHTKHDKKITRRDLEAIQTRMNVLGRGLAKVTGLGNNWGESNEARCWVNLSSEACIANLLYPSPKTHKDLDPEGNPASRPIVQASSCVTSHPIEILADILEAALLSHPIKGEYKNTEEMLARVYKANLEVEAHASNVCVGSGDVVGLYPSLRHMESAEMCAQVIKTCPAKFLNIDYHTCGVFVATNCSTSEISAAGLTNVVPSRKYK